MKEIRQTEQFSEWLKRLDGSVRGRIVSRLARVENDNFGDHKAISANVSEMRFDFGPGYRVYYTVRGNTVVFLLNGGDKKTQPKDIAKAEELAKEVK